MGIEARLLHPAGSGSTAAGGGPVRLGVLHRPQVCARDQGGHHDPHQLASHAHDAGLRGLGGAVDLGVTAEGAGEEGWRVQGLPNGDSTTTGSGCWGAVRAGVQGSVELGTPQQALTRATASVP